MINAAVDLILLILSLEIIIVFHIGCIRRRHQIPEALFVLMLALGRGLLLVHLICVVGDDLLMGLRVHSLPNKRRELVRLDVLERVVLALREEPHEDFFVGILLSLLVREVERILRLLVEGCERVRCLDERLLQVREVRLGRLSSD